VLTGGSYAEEIWLFDLGPLFMRGFRDLRDQLRKERLGITAKQSIAEITSQVFTALVVFGCISLSPIEPIQGLITMDDLVMYYQAFQPILEPLHPKAFLRPIKGGIRLEPVNFQYLGSRKRVLEDVTLTIRAGGGSTRGRQLLRKEDPDQTALQAI